MGGSHFFLFIDCLLAPVVKLRHVLIKIDLKSYPIVLLLLILIGVAEHV